MESMCPITREVLKKCYAKYPFPPVPEELVAMSEATLTDSTALRDGLLTASPALKEQIEAIWQIQLEKPPHKMDHNIYTNRCQLEYIAQLSAAAAGPAEAELKDLALKAAKTWQDYQVASAANVEGLVKTFVPQDFRGSIVNTFRARSEANAKAALEELISSGGTIQDKYNLMWKQQLDRRQTLVMLGNASGVFQLLVRYIGGVPQSLLDFLKTVNDEHGPMEEFRITYGPTQYFLTVFVFRMRVMMELIALSAKQQHSTDAAAAPQKASNLIPRLRAYHEIIVRFLDLLGQVLKNSPFFITKAEIDAINAESGAPVHLTVSKTHEVSVHALAGEAFQWEFTTVDNDIKFGVTFAADSTSSSSETKPAVMVPLNQVNSHLAPVIGEATAPCDGTFKITFDNSYSWFAKKELKFKTKLLPNAKQLEEDLAKLSIQAPPETTPSTSPDIVSVCSSPATGAAASSSSH